jgi:hypothetical protein
MMRPLALRYHLLRTVSTALAATLSVASCGEQAASGTDDARSTADALTGDAVGAATENPNCRLFTLAEVERYLGEPAEPGRNAGQGNACQWVSQDEEGDVMVSVLPRDAYVAPRGAQGFEAVQGIGSEAYVVPELGGYAAGAIVGEEAVIVSLTGQNASRATAVELLENTIARKR